MGAMSKPCIHCGSTVARLVSIALIRDRGGSTSEDPLKCSSRDGGEHEFNEEMAQ